MYFKYPRFYYKAVGTDRLGVPVIMYHTVNAADFERDLTYLKNNQYQTLTIHEFDHFLHTGEKPAEKCVLLTVDDGRKSLYKVIYPALKKFRMKAAAFILPYHHDHPDALAEYIPDKKKTLEEQFECRFDGKLFCSWDEIKEMHASGVVDIQSHAINQYRIPVSGKIVDFYHPEYRTGFALDRLPVSTSSEFSYTHPMDYGRPVYKNASRLDGFNAYYEDMALYNHCVQFVCNNGGRKFFKQSDWKKRLFASVHQYKKTNQINDKIESDTDKIKTMSEILTASKYRIEKILPGHAVQYIATPWGESSYLTIALAKDAGYQALFITEAIGLRAAQYGDNPYLIPRIDHRDHMVYSLPGKGRISFIQRFIKKWVHFLKHPSKFAG